ncbi:MAG: response regulator transcription factor [Myxococcales bacterium]|nr:response regulator transcription factor [Myxococcales bacterium]
MDAEQSILLVEDDPALALGLVDALEFEGFKVHHAQTGKDAVSLGRSASPSVIILDLMLPDMNGYQVCEQIRLTDRHVPILMLTARSQEADKIRGLDSGADDYVTKPFSLGELVARIRALLRRAGRGASTAPFRIGDAEIDPVKQVIVRDGDEQQLGFYEVELLKLLVARAGEPVSRDEILDAIWGLEASPTNRTVDNFIVKLRKKLEPQPDKPRHILTVYGVGYKLVV